MDINDLLKAWGLESLQEIFKDNDISLEVLMLLHDQNNLEGLVPSLGLRTLLIKHLVDYKSELRCEEISEEIKQTEVSQASKSILTYIPLNSPLTPSKTSSCTNISVSDCDSAILTPSQTPDVSIPSCSTSNHELLYVEDISYQDENFNPGKKPKLDNFDCNIRDILSKTIIGQAVLNSYDPVKGLDSKCQGYLTNIIISHFFDKDVNVRLTNNMLNKIADNIVQQFPAECKNVYYSSPIKKKYSKANKSGIARGKLVDKNRNILQFLRKSKIIANYKSNEDDSGGEDTLAYDCHIEKKSQSWLQNNVEPWNLVLEHWDTTFILRKKYSSGGDQKTTLTEIFDDWPIMKTSVGHLLIDMDFVKIFPNKTDRLFEVWDTFFKDIIGLKEQQLETSDRILYDMLSTGSIKKDGEDLIKLTLLFSVITVKSPKIVKKSGKKYWKPSIAESKDGMVVHVKAPGDIENMVESRRIKMQEWGLTLQPFIIVVGPTITDIQTIHVRIDSTLYNLPSLLKAIDICFKSFLIFDLQYPVECEHLWFALQWGVYNIKLKSDTKIPHVFDILKKANYLNFD